MIFLNFLILVILLVPPSIDESNVVYNRRVIQNRTIIVECPVSGIPTPVVTWLINDHPLQQTEGLIFTHNDYHLEILSAQVTDSATYTCVATNEAGTLKKKFHLEVQSRFLLLSRVMRKPILCICENKGADKLHGN